MLPWSSAAKARANFVKGVDRANAWQSVTEAFRNMAVPSLVYKSSKLQAVHRLDRDQPSAGDIFSFTTDKGSHFQIRITNVVPGHAFSYEEYSVDAGTNGGQTLMELTVNEDDIGLYLAIRRVDSSRLGLGVSDWSLLHTMDLLTSSRGNIALTQLKLLLGPESLGGATVEGWERLPIDRNGAVVEAD